MGELEGVYIGIGGEAPGGICKIIPPGEIFRIDGVAPAGVKFCPACNPWCWAFFYAT